MSNEHLSQEEIDRLLNGDHASSAVNNEDQPDFPQESMDKIIGKMENLESLGNGNENGPYPDSSQDEIDRMFSETIPPEYRLSDFQKDGLGEIGNISMGTASTTLSVLLNQKVNITTPVVSVTSWDSIKNTFSDKVILVKVKYTKGLFGSSILLLKEEDSKIISDLMMGGDGTNTVGELNDFHLSAISEAMNQMIGSSATSMSSMFDEIVDIAPPEVYSKILSHEDLDYILNDSSLQNFFVKTSFRLTVGSLIDSEIMQMLALPFAIDMFNALLNKTGGEDENRAPQISGQMIGQHPVDSVNQSTNAYASPSAGVSEENTTGHHDQNIVQFPADKSRNMDMLMAVPMDLTVELGRTEKSIRDILNIVPGSILELDKFQGDKVDIMVNGKKIAVGEVVVIDESYGVRITDIVKSSDRF